ncbi:hypothetical protein Tco_0887590, partial [Tanacetum coccineum]
DTPLSNRDSVAIVNNTYEVTVQSPMPMEKVETVNSSFRLVDDVCIDITKQAVPKEDANYVSASILAHISDGLVTNGLLNGPYEHELEKNDISSYGLSGVGNFPGLIKKRMARATHLTNLKSKKNIKSRGLVIGNSHLSSSSSDGSSSSYSSKAAIRDDIGKKLGFSFNHHSSNGVSEGNIDVSS